jgi:acyl-CoA thioester hydrolase
MIAMDSGPATDPRALRRADFDEVTRVSTRWADNDMFGHLNNAVYYELFDSAINAWMIRDTGVDETSSPEIGVVAESGCRFLRELAYPEPIDVAVRVARLGRTSITYELGLFAASEDEIAAFGRWVHVYIGRESRAAVPIPAPIRSVLEATVGRRA